METESTSGGEFLDEPVVKYIYKRPVKSFGNSAHILVPKILNGKNVYVLYVSSAITPLFLKKTKMIEGKKYVLVELPLGRRFYIQERKSKEFIILP